MGLREYQRDQAVAIAASDLCGGRDLLIDSQPVRGKLYLISDQEAGELTAINRQRWALSVPYLSWLVLGFEFPQAQGQLNIDGAGVPEGFAAGVYQVVEVVGLDPSVYLILTRNF